MIPGISAGSNHVGASETCTPQVSCPSGPDPLAMPGAAISNVKASMAQVRAWTPRAPFDLSLFLRKEADEHVAACPTSWAGMAFPLRMRCKRRSFQPRSLGSRWALMRTDFIVSWRRPGQNPCLGDPDYRTSLRTQGSGEPKFAPCGLARAHFVSLLTGGSDPRNRCLGRGPNRGSKDNRSGYLLIIGRLRPGLRALRSPAHCPALEYPQARL